MRLGVVRFHISYTYLFSFIKNQHVINVTGLWGFRAVPLKTSRNLSEMRTAALRHCYIATPARASVAHGSNVNTNFLKVVTKTKKMPIGFISIQTKVSLDSCQNHKNLGQKYQNQRLQSVTEKSKLNSTAIKSFLWFENG